MTFSLVFPMEWDPFYKYWEGFFLTSSASVDRSYTLMFIENANFVSLNLGAAL